jgi:phage-related protein
MADTSIGKAYVQIVPKAEGITGQIEDIISPAAEESGEKGGASLGKSLLKGLATAGVVAGVTKLFSDSIGEGSKLQQSFGGLETLYGDAADQAKEYAYMAAQAGISANDYAEQAVSFGASLKSAFGGDTEKAVEAANTAIMDMTDNAAKMGTPIESIQNAYQGFAKGQYNMLDNLKLGYGGTKTEMERLLADASKLSGVEYNIDNLGDVYEAIHVIQDDLGLTGVAAEEAAGTFSGSMQAMKASLENLMAEIATGGDVTGALGTLMENVGNFLFGNLLPMLGDIILGIPPLLTELLNTLPDMISQGLGDGTSFLEFAQTLLSRLAETLFVALPNFLASIYTLIGNVLQQLMAYDWGTFASNAMSQLTNAISNFVSTFFSGDTNLLQSLIDWTANTLPQLIEQGISMILSLVDGFWAALPDLLTSLLSIITSMLNTFIQNLPKIIETGIKILTSLALGLIQGIPKVLAALPKIFLAIINAFKNVNWGDIGHNIITGIVNGLKAAAHMVIDYIKDLASQALDSIKEFFGIASPSKVMRDEVGRWIPAGMAVGIQTNAKEALKAMNDLSEETFAAFDFSQMSAETSGMYSGISVATSQQQPAGITQNISIQTTDNSPDELARRFRIESRYGLMTGGALG